MQWEAKMATGIAKVDAQHKELIRQVNELMDAMKAGKGRQIIGDVLAFLGKYAVEHFATEEALMQRHGYPGYAEHKAVHEAFKKDFGALAAEYDRNPEKLSVTIQVQHRVMDWLRDHILGIDQKLGAFLREKGVA
ncbi:bacteriohemerythrin [Deferrisoma sp.]